MKFFQNRDLEKDNITWAGLTYHVFSEALKIKNKKRKIFAAIIAGMLFYMSPSFFHSYSEKKLVSNLEDKKKQELENQQEKKDLSHKYAQFFRLVVDFKAVIENEIEKKGNNDWLKDKENLLKLADYNGWYDYFRVDYIDLENNEYVKDYSDMPVRVKDMRLVTIKDADDDKIYLFQEGKNNFSIQLNYKTSDACKHIIHPIKGLKKVEINTIEVDPNDDKLIQKQCDVNEINDIRYYF